MGRYHRTLEPGMNVLVPIIDKVGWMFQIGTSNPKRGLYWHCTR